MREKKMHKQIAIPLVLLFCTLCLPLWAEDEVWFEQFDRTIQYDLSTTGRGMVNTVYDNYGQNLDNDNSMVGDIGCNGLDGSEQYVVFTVTPDANGFSMKTPQDVSAKRRYVIQVFGRRNSQATPGGGESDSDITSYTAVTGTAAENTDYGKGTTTTSTDYAWVTNDGTLTVIMPAKGYRRIHADFILTFPTLDKKADDLYDASDYSSSFTVTVGVSQNADGSDVVNVSSYTYTLGGYYHSDGSTESSSCYFSVSPSSLAAKYPLDDASVTASYADGTVGTIDFFTIAKSGSAVTALSSLPYAIAIGSTSGSYSAAGDAFQFVNTIDATKTIPYYARIAFDTASASTHNLVAVDDYVASMRSTSDDLTGTEAIDVSTISSSDTGRRFLVIPQEYSGRNGNDSRSVDYYRYWYKGDIQIMLPAEERTKIASGATYPSGLYTTTLYVFLIAR